MVGQSARRSRPAWGMLRSVRPNLRRHPEKSLAFDPIGRPYSGAARCDTRSRLLAIALILGTIASLACSRPSVLVLGLDGADWDVIDPLLDAGYLPTIGRIVDSGVRAHLDCVPANPAYPCYCPPVWMTVATGQPFQKHDIAHGTQLVSERKSKAIWTLLHEQTAGLLTPAGTSTLIAWHNLWPPESDVAYVVTREALRAASDQIYDRLEPEPSERLADTAHHTHPADLFQDLALLPHDGERRPAWGPLAMDRVAMTALDRIAERGSTALTMVILHGIDKDAHIGWARIQNKPEEPVDPEAVLRIAAKWKGPAYAENKKTLGDPVGPILEVDAWLARHLEFAHYDYILLASDHGMTRNHETGGVAGTGAHGAESTAAHEGIFVLSGPGVVAGLDLKWQSVLDVAQTIAYLLDLPVAADLPGSVLRAAFTKEQLEKRPIRVIPSWDD